MKNCLVVKHDKREIVMDRTFAKLSENVRSKEYQLLQSTRRDYPEYTVIRKTIKKNTSKECYRGLTYDFMRDYITAHEDDANGICLLNELEQMITISHCHSQAYRYPVIKKWFLEQFPEVKEFGATPEPSDADEDNLCKIA